ncbi:MAG: phosphatidylglycerophosphatase A [Planctomycetota bacterium]|nr:phosphatidylglycerophosphatase A [Planctomycetota bacterium]
MNIGSSGSGGNRGSRGNPGSRLRLAIVSCGFLGCSPVVPGTVGTLGGVLIVFLLGLSGNFLLWTVLAGGAIYVVGRSLGDWAERHAGKKDPGFFVLDEVVGYMVTCLWIRGPSLLALVLGFFVFRFFDVVKPPPCRRLERIGGGDGIMLDDVAAGLYGLAVMAAARVLLLEPENWVS